MESDDRAPLTRGEYLEGMKRIDERFEEFKAFKEETKASMAETKAFMAEANARQARKDEHEAMQAKQMEEKETAERERRQETIDICARFFGRNDFCTLFVLLFLHNKGDPLPRCCYPATVCSVHLKHD